MTLRREFIQKLVSTNHLNVEERRELGSPSVTREEIATVVIEVLTSEGFFPPHARPWNAGSTVYEGYFLEKTQAGYILHFQRHQALDPNALAETFDKHYRTVDKAVLAYIKQEFEGNIDGIPIS